MCVRGENVNARGKETRDMHKTVERLCEEMAKRQLSVSQGEMPQTKPKALTPWSKNFSPKNCEKINFCWCSHTLFMAVLENEYNRWLTAAEKLDIHSFTLSIQSR
jgi:hypothetical protein